MRSIKFADARRTWILESRLNWNSNPTRTCTVIAPSCQSPDVRRPQSFQPVLDFININN
jgi:hypothetical protein